MEYERVREKIARIIWSDGTGDEEGFEYQNPKSSLFKMTDQILSLDGIEIRVDNPSLPYTDETTGYDLSLEQVRIVKQMLKPDPEGRVWIRVIPKPKRK